MDITHIYDKFILIENNLIPYGFKLENNIYTIKKDIINNTMYAVFTITKDKIDVNVYDYFDNEIYLPFNIINSKGEFVNTVKDETSIHLEDILKNCFKQEDVKIKLNAYVKEKYNIEPTYIIENERYAYKINNKWFGFVMKAKYQWLGIQKEGIVDILNVKLKEEEINNIVDNKYIFKAYHMNKKHWITIMLSPKFSFNDIIKYIDKSYDLISNATKNDV